MSTETRHFVLTQEGAIREFSAEQAANIAAGGGLMPEFADRRMRYLQVVFEADQDAEIRVRTAGAAIQFDAEGRLTEAEAPSEGEVITRFEHDACVQWALRGVSDTPITLQ